MKRWRIALPLALGLACPDLAGAAEPGAGIAVSYADLDLSQQEGARRLHARVRSAIRTVCAQPSQGVLASPAESRCRRTARAMAQVQIERAVALATDRRNLAQRRFASAAAR